MPYLKIRRGGKWKVYKKGKDGHPVGKALGTHDTRAEAQAQNQGRKVTIAKFPWGASGRAITLDRTDGLTKLILDTETERILGVGLVGPGAGELIAEGVLAIEMGATARDIAESVHPHPTLSETVMEAAEVFYGYSTHTFAPKKHDEEKPAQA